MSKTDNQEQTALTTQSQDFFIAMVDLSAIGNVFAEEMDGLFINFDKVKIPSGGGLTFEIPGEDPSNPDVVREIVGVIIDHYPINAYWASKYTGSNDSPDCFSVDGKTGIQQDGISRACATCPMNQFGSDGRGKACKNMHRIFLLRPGEVFPLQMTLPPTSLKNLGDYIFKRVVNKGKRLCEVVTKIALKKETNSDGIVYSQAVFSLVNTLNQEIAAQMVKLSSDLKPLTRKVSVVAEDYGQAPQEESCM